MTTCCLNINYYKHLGIWIGILTLNTILFWTLLSASNGYAATINVSEAEQIFLGPYIGYIEDPSGKLDIVQVANMPATKFKTCSRTSPGFGFTSSVFWFKFSLYNPEKKQVTRFLEVEYPLLDHLDLYVADKNGQFQVYREGDRQPFFNRPIKYRNFVFILTIPANSTIDYYLRVQTSSSLNLPARLYTQASFMDKIENEETALGIYFGILFAMLAYNLILFFTIREAVYLYYVLFVIFYFLFQLDLTGVAFKYLWPNNVYWANESLPFFIFVAYIFGTLFTRQILNTKLHAPFIDQILITFMALSLICAGLCLLFPYEISIKVATLVTTTVIVHIFTGFLCLFKGYRPARYYALAWSISMAGAAIYAFKSFGLLPNNFITVWGIQIGSAWEVILLSMALSDRLSLLQKEKDRIQAEYTRKLEEANLRLEEFAKTLEEKVRQRTKELERSNALLKRQAEEMRLAEERAERASKAKSDFLANMSHEIRTPLNAITGITALSLEMELPAKLREYLNIIKVSANSLLNLVNDILDFSKIEAGKMELEQTEFPLLEVIENIADMFTEIVSEKAVEFIIDIDSNVPDQLVGDPVRLGQLLTNLVSNAIKFTDKGQILLACTVTSKTKDKVTLSFKVADTGIGIEKNRLEYLFDMFTQADSSTTRRFGGTGLGLTICKRIAQLMKGTIHVESEPDVGTTFTFTVELPYTDKKSPLQLTKSKFTERNFVLLTQNDDLIRGVENILKRLGDFHLTVFKQDVLKKELFPKEMKFDEKNYFIADVNNQNLKDILQLTDLVPRNRLLLLVPFDFERKIQNDAQNTDYFICLKPLTINRFIRALNLVEEGHSTPDKIHKRQIRFRGLRVLVVEDNEINQMVAREILEKFGAEVKFAKNGVEAINKVSPEVDIIFMDIQMPDMDGYDATKILRQRKEYAEIPIIAMTAGVFEEDRQRCLKVGMNDFVLKPVTPESILSILKRWVKPSKISYSEEETNTKQHPHFPPIPGANISEAKERFKGNPKMYLELVKRFVKDNSDIKNIVSAIRSDSDAKGLKRFFHTQKGVCANLALSELQTLFWEAENYIEKQDESHNNLDAIINKIQKRINTIAQSLGLFQDDQKAQPMMPQNAQGAEDIPLKNLAAKLDELIRLNDIESEDVWRELKEQIKEKVPQQELSRMDELLEDFEFEAARECLRQISSKLF